MNYWQAIILSIVEGVTEFLPISSTGHLVLTARILNVAQTDFVKSFEIIIQLGAILAVVVLYWKSFLRKKEVLKRVLVAFIPTAIVGLVLYKVVKELLLGNEAITLVALFIGGLSLIVIEFLYKDKYQKQSNKFIHDDLTNLSFRFAFLIGVCQAISIIPGVSRAAATIVGGLFCGLSRKTAIEFSFLLAVPTIAGATGLDLLKSNFNFDKFEFSLLTIGFIGSFLVAFTVIRLFLRYVEKNVFTLFGIYRMILALAYWFFIIR